MNQALLNSHETSNSLLPYNPYSNNPLLGNLLRNFSAVSLIMSIFSVVGAVLTLIQI